MKTISEQLCRKVLKGLYFAQDARLSAERLADKYKLISSDFTFIDDPVWDTQCFMLLMRDGELLISFRGSQQARDWITDFAGWTVPYSNKETKIKLHWGFNQAYCHYARGQIHKFISLHSKNIKMITITGYSLGGSLATLCAVDLEYNNIIDKNLIEVFCAGNPKVGNKEFVDSFNKRVPKCWRTFNVNDIVPSMPPSIMGYQHAGLENPWGVKNPLSGIIEYFKCKELRKRSKFDMGDVVNHEINSYILYFERKLKSL